MKPITDSHATPPDTILRRSRRWVHIMGGLSIILWTAVAGWSFCAIYSFFVFVYPRLVHGALDEPPSEQNTAALREIMSDLIPSLTMISITVWASLLVLAAVSTVWFISCSRRATLKQLQAGLDDISRQLRALARNAQ